jgi:hypothetical protein
MATRTKHRLIARGPVVARMDIGQVLTVRAGFDLELVYVEDSVTILKGSPQGKPEAWTASEERPGWYYRVGRRPANAAENGFYRLLDKAFITRRLMDGAIGILESGSFSFQAGNA